MKFSTKALSLFLAISIILQGCTVYKSVGNLDEAVEAKTKSKVFYKDQRIKIYDKITKENGEYYGWFKNNIKYLIDADLVNYVKSSNKTVSAIATGGAALGTAAIVAAGVLSALIIIAVIAALRLGLWIGIIIGSPTLR